MTVSAQTALGYYYNKAASLDPSIGSFSDFETYIQGINPTFEKYFGQALAAATQLSPLDVQQAMENLAEQANGAMPQTARDLSTFFDALENLYGTYNLANWTRIVKSTAADTVTAVETTAAVAAGGAAIYFLVIGAVFLIALVKK
jgi:hypothetical protein